MPPETPHTTQEHATQERPGRHSSRKAVFAFLALLASAVWGLGAVLESRVEEGRGGGLRNPHAERDWWHHVYEAVPRRDGERLIVLISNSQGYGRSVPDENTFAALLEGELAAAGDGAVRVLNWAIPGGLGPEFVLLAAAACRLDPTRVLVLTSRGNFTDESLTQDGRDTPLTGFASDVYQMAAYSDVRSHLPQHFRASYVDSTIRLDGLMARASKLWRYRDMTLRRWRSPWWTRALRRPQLRVRRAEHGARGRAERRPKPGGRSGNNRTFALASSPEGEQPSAGVEPEHPQVRLQLLEDLLAAGPESRMVLVQMPKRAKRAAGQDSFDANVRRLASSAGAEFWDLSATVPKGEFESPAHFTAAGHLRFSRILIGRLGS